MDAARPMNHLDELSGLRFCEVEVEGIDHRVPHRQRGSSDDAPAAAPLVDRADCKGVNCESSDCHLPDHIKQKMARFK